jgi:hypothetical protein
MYEIRTRMYEIRLIPGRWNGAMQSLTSTRTNASRGTGLGCSGAISIADRLYPASRENIRRQRQDGGRFRWWLSSGLRTVIVLQTSILIYSWGHKFINAPERVFRRSDSDCAMSLAFHRQRARGQRGYHAGGTRVPRCTGPRSHAYSVSEGHMPCACNRIGANTDYMHNLQSDVAPHGQVRAALSQMAQGAPAVGIAQRGVAMTASKCNRGKRRPGTQVRLWTERRAAAAKFQDV